MRSLLCVSVLGASLFFVRAAWANEAPAGTPSTAEVLGKLHRSNVKEIRMGEMAREHGRARTFSPSARRSSTITTRLTRRSRSSPRKRRSISRRTRRRSARST